MRWSLWLCCSLWLSCSALVDDGSIAHAQSRLSRYESSHDTTIPRHLAIARAYVGTTEIRRGSNAGTEVNRFLRTVGLGPGNEWCAAFVSTCLTEGRVVSPTVRAGLARRFKIRGYVDARVVLSGQVTIPAGWIVGWQRGTTVHGHIGFANVPWRGVNGVAVEGNTSNPVPGRPDGVFIKKRSIHPGNTFRVTWFLPVEYGSTQGGAR